MTTADLIASHLGPDWWDRTHDDTALLSLLDRIMEERECEPDSLAAKIAHAATNTASKSGYKGLSLWFVWYARVSLLTDTLLSPKVT